jgi:hypothetical protein
MRLFVTGCAAALTAVVIVQAHAGAQVAGTPFEANRIVCAEEGAKVISDLRKEIAAAQQPTWTAAQERERQESDLKEALNDPSVRARFKEVFPELWNQATDFIEKPELVLAACAITLADAWDAGVRAVPQLKQRWAEAQYTTYKLPGASAPASSFGGSGGSSGSRASSAPATSEDPSGSDPVDCVSPNDTPGSFRNRCDFDVYFTYCGVNPEEGSWVAECSKQKFGLLDIAAGGVQAAFTRAETLYVFACRSPKTPKEVEFVSGNGLRGFCR